MSKTATLIPRKPPDIIDGLMIREAIIAERDRRKWNNLKLSQESGVPYSRLYEWLHDPEKTISSRHVDSLMGVMGLRVCRGIVKPEKRAAK